MTRNRGFLLFSLAVLLLLPSASAFAGSVHGTVTYDGEIPTLKPLDMSADPACVSKNDAPVMPQVLVLGDGQTLGNVFVQVKNAPSGPHEAPSEPVVVDQVGCVYHPHVAGVLAGQPILFKNSDGILHNVHGQPEANDAFNIAMPPILKEREWTPNQPEPLFPVKCDVHPWMNAYIAVMDHPYFTVTAADGKYEIGDLPPGDYEIEIWHEKLGTKTQKVTVGDGAATADFVLSR